MLEWGRVQLYAIVVHFSYLYGSAWLLALNAKLAELNMQQLRQFQQMPYDVAVLSNQRKKNCYIILLMCAHSPTDPCRTAVDSILLKLLRLCRKTSDMLRLRLISVLWFILSLAIALFVPGISYIIDFTGGLAAMFIFVFPGIYNIICERLK